VKLTGSDKHSSAFNVTLRCFTVPEPLGEGKGKGKGSEGKNGQNGQNGLGAFNANAGGPIQCNSGNLLPNVRLVSRTIHTDQAKHFYNCNSLTLGIS
jgi:hypothetical protein